jgi:hypothetical protein
MSLSVSYQERDFGDALRRLPLAFAVEDYGWHVEGGPDTATISATGPTLALWELAEMLRYPFQIHEDGEPVWWGYLGKVEIAAGGVRYGCDLESMANRIATMYVDQAASSIGGRADVPWLEDTDSIATYGRWARLDSASVQSPAAADELTAANLALYKYPIPVVEPGYSGTAGARLTCYGWWHALKRHYYAYPTEDTTLTEASVLIGRMVDDFDQFLRGVEVIDTGMLRPQHYDGDRNTQEDIIGLLECGTANNRRLHATVTPLRYLRIAEEPASSDADLLLTADGRLRERLGLAVTSPRFAVGRWARLVDGIPASVDTARLSDPTKVFIEAAEYDGREGRMTIRGRGQPDTWALARIEAA